MNASVQFYPNLADVSIHPNSFLSAYSLANSALTLIGIHLYYTYLLSTRSDLVPITLTQGLSVFLSRIAECNLSISYHESIQIVE